MAAAPVLLIHGWGFGPGAWRRVTRYLQTTAPILAPALPGYDSEPEREQARTPLAALEQVLVRLDQPAVVVGWSCGGLLALQLEQAWPERVRALVLVASMPCLQRRPDWPAGIDRTGLAAVRQRLDADHGAAIDYVTALSIRGDRRARTVRRELEQAVPAGLRAETLGRDLDLIEQTDLRTVQPDSTLDVILGENDRVIGSSCAMVLPEWYPRVRLHVLRGAGHAPMISRPRAVAGLLEQLV